MFKTRAAAYKTRAASFLYSFKTSLIIHKENTKEINTMSVILDVIKFCLKFLPNFYGLGNVDLQNNHAIELMRWVVFEVMFKTRIAVLYQLKFKNSRA